MKELGKTKLSVIVAILAIFVLIAGIAIAGKTGTISGTVKDSVTSAAIVGATVTAGSYTATTNSSGAYSMSANAGNYTVTASATGYAPASQSATVVVGQTKTVNFSLVKTVSNNGTMAGTVKDSVTSAAIVGATVKAGTAATATTDSTGSYSMSVPATSYTVTASATGYTTGSQQGTVTAGQTTIVNFLLVTAPVTSSYKVIAWNDLGMHCACPGAETFLLLPPFNTLRAQVLQYGGNDPVVVSSGVTVSYNIVEDTKARLDVDPYFQNWVTFSKKIFPPPFSPTDASGNYVSISGKKLADTMEYNATTMGYEAIGIPAFPVVTGTSTDIMTDPLGTGASYPKRTPYLTGAITVKDANGATVATTSTVVPVAFGGCCTCHLPLASQHGYPQTPVGSFQYMGFLHGNGQHGTNIDFSKLDPDGDGVGGPVRCSWCHWDPAMAEDSAKGILNFWPQYKILAGAGFTKTDVRVSTKSFSAVLHGFHANSPAALAMDPNLATTNCYACHPGNSVNCFRGAMLGHAQCKDCHGDLIQRQNSGQFAAPWQQSTLPTCNAPSPGIPQVVACHDSRTYPTPGTWTGVFGKFLNSRGHKGSIQCLTCHGSPHAEVPSTLAKDNTQLINANNGLSKPLGVCTFCHPNKSSTWSVLPHGNIRR